MTELARFPHCDQRILHGPEDGCEYCNAYPEWQALRAAWGIAFTGHAPRGSLPECGHPLTGAGWWPGAKCRQPIDHDSDHFPSRAWDILPCPADFDRPEDSPGDHRKWPGNRPEGYR